MFGAACIMLGPVPVGRRAWYVRLAAALLLVLAASPFTFPFGTCDLMPPGSGAGVSVAAQGKVPDGSVLGSSAATAPMAGGTSESMDARHPALFVPDARSPRLVALRL